MTLPPMRSPEIHDGKYQHPDVADALNRVAVDLAEGNIEAAIDAIKESRIASSWLTNALGVCELRRGNADRAIQIFRDLVIDGNRILMRPNVPTEFKANYATALLVGGNVGGCLNALAEIKENAHPAVQSVRRAVTRWKESLSFWQKISFHLGGEPSQPLPADMELGYL